MVKIVHVPGEFRDLEKVALLENKSQFCFELIFMQFICKNFVMCVYCLAASRGLTIFTPDGK